MVCSADRGRGEVRAPAWSGGVLGGPETFEVLLTGSVGGWVEWWRTWAHRRVPGPSRQCRQHEGLIAADQGCGAGGIPSLSVVAAYCSQAWASSTTGCGSYVSMP